MEGLSAKSITAICATGAIALIINYASVEWFKYPFLYCWPQPLLKPIWQPISAYGGVALMGVLLVCGLLGKWHAFLLASGWMLLFYGLPQFMEILFKLGGSCNG